jgi:peptidoglycan/LPS O-acetylase OafA/YrhL
MLNDHVSSNSEASIGSSPMESVGFSTQLDLLRCTAAIAVLLNHFLTEGWTGFDVPNWLLPNRLGHAAVVVFFVLSGYVICYAACERERDPVAYAINRLSRIYSVALPALLLTMVVDLTLLIDGKNYVATTGHWIPIAAYPYQKLWLYFPFYLLFGTDLWFLNESAFSDAPFWSLSYECWYYVLFGVIWFCRGKPRLAISGAILLLVGPRLLVELPVWLLGSAAYWLHRRNTVHLNRSAARTIVACSCLAMIVSIYRQDAHSLTSLVAQSSWGWMLHNLRYSTMFIDDFLLAVVCVIGIFAGRYAALNFGILQKPIVALASWTMSIYLFHYPLAELFVGHFELRGVSLIATVAISIYVLGTITEHQKGRWRAAIRWILRRPSNSTVRIAAGV